MANITPAFICRFPKLNNPLERPPTELSKKYEVRAMWPAGADLSVIKEQVLNAAKERFGTPLPKGLHMPFRKDKEDVFFGNEWSPMRNERRPMMHARDPNRDASPDDFYDGCQARAMYEVFAYDAHGGRGVRLTLKAIQFIADGDPLGTGSMSFESSQDAFASEPAPETDDTPDW